MAIDTKTFVPQPKVYKSPPFTVEVPGVEKIAGESIPRRNVAAKNGLKQTPEEGVNTVYDILRRGAEKFGNAKALGSRKLIQTHNEVKKVKKIIDGKEQSVDKTWTYFELGPYEYMSYIEYERMALQLGAGLRKLGLNKDEKVQIYASTSPHWLAIAHGCGSQSMPIVTAYDTLGEEGIKHSLMQSNAVAIFLEPSLISKIKNALKEAKEVKHVIYNTDSEVKAEDIDALKKDHPQITVHSFEELRQLGQDNPVDPVPPSADDLCCIMYTSGSTGTPKGVLLKHKNVIAAVAGADSVVGRYIGPGDGLLTYLPLAHILEFMFENAVLFWGGTMGYGNIKTLSDTSVRNCKGDIREFQPSILIGVPQVWETVKKGIMSKVNALNPIVRNLVWAAMGAKSTMLSMGIPGSSTCDIILGKIKEATGGKLRIAMNGGGPIAKETQRFISLAIAPMISGYGLTETAGMGALMDPMAWTDDALGEIPASAEIKLVDVEELGYFSTNQPAQGEIWIRGGSVTEGYLDLEKENKESFSSDGWFLTGDIGEFDSRGNLKIIDRKKNMVKTLNGEYIALEKLESVYRSCSVVSNICVYAASDKQKPVAIIVPAESALKNLAQQSGAKGNNLEELVQDKKLNAAVLKEMQNTGKQGGLSGIEIIEGVAMADEDWTPQNGLTTSAQKLNRRAILEKYKKEVDQAYGDA